MFGGRFLRLRTTISKTSYADWSVERIYGSTWTTPVTKRWKDSQSGIPNDFEDVFSADFVREFDWTDDKLFIDRPDGEGRLLFSLNLDFFNVEGVRQRGASTSTGVIAMACLNLPSTFVTSQRICTSPASFRDRTNQTYIQINHFLAPLVDDLKDSWDRGFLFTHSPHRVVRCAIACAVCDLVGARKLSCMAGVGSNHLCTVCACFGKESRGRVDFDGWSERDPASLRAAAERYRDAALIADQDKIFSEHGVRWGELWRLPYWNPSKQLVIDPMHCLLEGPCAQAFSSHPRPHVKGG